MKPETFLLAFHARHAGLTSRTFAGGRCEDGRSSYELLAELPAPTDIVLDLACGDGYLLELIAARGVPRDHLIGVDMSEAEIAAARARPALAGVRLQRERAQALSAPDASIDCAVSHLAFMLMSDLPDVVAELARVLRPKARFASIVGGGPVDDDAFSLFLDLFRDAYEAQPARAPRLGDKRTRDREGWAELFGATGAFEPTIEESVHDVRLDDTPDALWPLLSTIYEMFVFDVDTTEALRGRFVAAATARANADGVVPCTMRMRYLAIRRR